MNGGCLATADVGSIGFLEVGDNPALWRHDEHELAACGDELPGFHADFAQFAIGRCVHCGVVEIDAGKSEHGAGAVDTGFYTGFAGFHAENVLFGGSVLRFRLCKGGISLLKGADGLVNFAALILRVVFSWFEAPARIAQPVSQLTRPLLEPIQRFLPPVGGIDLSPLCVILALELIILFV